MTGIRRIINSSDDDEREDDEHEDLSRCVTPTQDMGITPTQDLEQYGERSDDAALATQSSLGDGEDGRGVISASQELIRWSPRVHDGSLRLPPEALGSSSSSQDTVGWYHHGSLPPMVPFNLNAVGIDRIPLSSAEAILASRKRNDGSNRTLLDALTTGKDSYQAVCEVFEQLGTESERAAEDCLMAYRYIVHKGLWKGHPDNRIDSPEKLLGRLNCFGVLAASLSAGLALIRTKQKYIDLIEEAWGREWFRAMTMAFPSQTWQESLDLPRSILVEIAANVRQELSLEEALVRWKKALTDRCDPNHRRQYRLRNTTSEQLQPSDIAYLNQRRPAHDKYLSDIPQPQWPTVVLASAPPVEVRPAAKRRRRQKATTAASAQWAVSASGNHEIAHLKNQTVRRPRVNGVRANEVADHGDATGNNSDEEHRDSDNVGSSRSLSVLLTRLTQVSAALTKTCPRVDYCCNECSSIAQTGPKMVLELDATIAALTRSVGVCESTAVR